MVRFSHLFNFIILQFIPARGRKQCNPMRGQGVSYCNLSREGTETCLPL